MTKLMGKTLSKDHLMMLFLYYLLRWYHWFFHPFLRPIFLPMSGLILYLTTIGVILLVTKRKTPAFFVDCILYRFYL